MKNANQKNLNGANTFNVVLEGPWFFEKKNPIHNCVSDTKLFIGFFNKFLMISSTVLYINQFVYIIISTNVSFYPLSILSSKFILQNLLLYFDDKKA